MPKRRILVDMRMGSISEHKHHNIWTWKQVAQTHTPGWNLMTPANTNLTIKSKVNLKESTLTPKGKARGMHMIMKYKQAFSIRDEIGECLT